MPRKRSSSGRSRAGSQLVAVNRQFRELQRAGELGRYASKKVLRLAREEPKLFKVKRSGRFRFLIRNQAKLSPIEKRAVFKRFQEFLSSKLGTPENIKRTRAETRRKVKTRLQGLLDKELTDKDIDEFYELTHDEDFRYLADKIGDSDVYVLLSEIRESGGDEEDLLEKLRQFMIFSNSSDAADRAKKLYNKWAK